MGANKEQMACKGGFGWVPCGQYLPSAYGASSDSGSSEEKRKSRKRELKKTKKATARDNKKKEKALEVERAVTKAYRPVEKYGDVDHQLKKIRVEGMQSQVLKNRADAIKTNVDSIRSQIELMQQILLLVSPVWMT